MSSETFWNSQEQARKVVGEVRSLKAQLDPLTQAVKDFEDAKVAYEMSREAGDKDLLAEADRSLFQLSARMNQIEQRDRKSVV